MGSLKLIPSPLPTLANRNSDINYLNFSNASNKYLLSNPKSL